MAKRTIVNPKGTFLKKKKESFWEEILLTILVILLILAIPFWYFGDFPYNEDRQCKNKRIDWVEENCVCEEPSCIQYYDDGTCFLAISSVKNLNCRKATQQELAIENCNNNPNDDDCFCEEYNFAHYVNYCIYDGDLCSGTVRYEYNSTQERNFTIPLVWIDGELGEVYDYQSTKTCTKARPKK